MRVLFGRKLHISIPVAGKPPELNIYGAVLSINPAEEEGNEYKLHLFLMRRWSRKPCSRCWDRKFIVRQGNNHDVYFFLFVLVQDLLSLVDRSWQHEEQYKKFFFVCVEPCFSWFRYFNL
ncbi:hypothetical protein VU00_10941 [Candidatus Electrothrix marina]|uniref:Uncharacterized protein n=1 Tax=Candidatus Electrothrix marina TaxID=1859130 RepID=A0A3S3UH34_9BACT|nr:hypothetical protein VU00_10941 [Candidatus Electrothrix marina]